MPVTNDHDIIQHWAKRFGAVPAERKVFTFDSEPALLHFLFGAAKAGTPELRPITWEDFFARFDLLGLSVALDNESPDFDIVRVATSSSSMQT